MATDEVRSKPEYTNSNHTSEHVRLQMLVEARYGTEGCVPFFSDKCYEPGGVKRVGERECAVRRPHTGCRCGDKWICDGDALECASGHDVSVSASVGVSTRM